MVKTSEISIEEFNKYILKPDLSNDDFKKIFDDLNHHYFEKSKEILDKNTERSELLDKIRTAQNIYKKKSLKKKLNIIYY